MKVSSAKAIRSKQSSAYSYIRSSTPAIHQIDGSSAREMSRRKHQALRSFGARAGGVSQAMLDAAAEKIMNQGYSRSRNPICSSCYIQKAINGSCSCTD
jgi:hypothetical protein